MKLLVVSVAVLEVATAFSPSIPSTRASQSGASVPTPLPTRRVPVRNNKKWHLPASATSTDGVTNLARLTTDHLQELRDKKYVVIPNFLPPTLEDDLRTDVANLRRASKFNVAKIGQDSTNALNTQIRVAETCFIGPGRYPDVPAAARKELCATLDQARQDIATFFAQPLDQQLTELLYAYYPQGGFYRRHRDAIPGSASVLREFSLLLYLNKDWTDQDGGQLRMHFDGGGDELPEGMEPNFMDVTPDGGTLVLFESDAIPHEVIDTQKERIAVIGWYNRPMGLSDVAEISGGEAGNPMQLVMLGFAAALVSIGVAQILM